MTLSVEDVSGFRGFGLAYVLLKAEVAGAEKLDGILGSV